MRAPKFWNTDQGANVSANLLAPFVPVYSASDKICRAFISPKRVEVPIICVGNVTVGGGGKTPTALALARMMKDWGVTVHFLTRGYGGTAHGPLRVDAKQHNARKVGDEPILLARYAPTWLARKRPSGARLAIAAGAEAIIMDDGFQNPSLVKDVSLMVVDAAFGFGNERRLPAGPLREPVTRGLARADAVVLIGTDEGGLAAQLSGSGVPLLRAELTPSLQALKLRDCDVVAFAGIARPAKFFTTLEAIGCNIIRRVAFADHHRFTPNEIMTLVEQAGDQGAIPVTTEKDWVRLPLEARAMVKSVPVTLEWENPDAVERLIRPALGDGTHAGG
ncbi:MAG: tetraacyldisaccharide 4'-kinase [Rhodospirillaceae bacterium]|nr:tetraacyldisaccharide 4'-kinase [Rhodospirillaceae bacterium]